MEQQVTKGTTSKIMHIKIMDADVVVPNAGRTGLTPGDLTSYYMRAGASAPVEVTLASIVTLGTYISGGFREVNAAFMPGVYEFHPPDATLAVGADACTFAFNGSGSVEEKVLEVQLIDFDLGSAQVESIIAGVKDNAAADALADAIGNRDQTIAAGTLTVRNAAGTADLYTQAVTTDAGADQVTALT